MDERVMEGAARGGNLDLVQWLRGEGCEWRIDTCHHAIKQGHVELLRWLRENGCPWHSVDRNEAAAKLGYTDDFAMDIATSYDPLT